MGLVSKVIERVRAYYPYGSNRYSDSALTKMIHAADCVMRERAELSWKTKDIGLVANAIYYSLPDDAIRVHSVLYSIDGTNFDDGVLKPLTLKDLDMAAPYWHSTGGDRPQHYTVFSTPGVPGKSYLMIWPKVSSVTSQKVRVQYTYYFPSYASTTFLAADDVEDWILDECYVPHVLAQMYAQEDPRKAADLWAQFLVGARRAEAARANRYGDTLGGARISGPGMTEGYLL